MKKIDIAIEMLETAIELFLDGKSYISSLHLAGAAEELFSGYLKGVDSKFALAEDVEATNNLYRFLYSEEPVEIREMIIRPKNSAKHMDGLTDDNFTYNPKYEAERILDRAIRNYYLIIDKGVFGLSESLRIKQFLNIRRGS